jgi:lauroyl/myristoyl acyltransferase
MGENMSGRVLSRFKDIGEQLLALLFRYLPITWVSGLGDWLGARHGRQAIAARRLWVDRMHRNLERLWGITDVQEREQRIIGFTRRVGRIYIEYPVLRRMVSAGRIEIVGAENLENLSKPVILAGCHVSNWELLGRVFELIGGRWVFTYLPLGDGVRARQIYQARASWLGAGGESGEQVPASATAMRQVTKAVAEGRNLLLYVDEEKNGYVWAPNLGRKIPYAGNRWFAARLAARHGLDILPVHVEPNGPARYRVVIEPKLTAPLEGDSDSKARFLADRLDEHLDSWVRQWLDHWYWLPQLDLDKSAPSYTASDPDGGTAGVKSP